MKSFLGTFVICFVICLVAVFLLSGVFARNAWVDLAVISLLLASLVTVLVKHSIRIEELEETIRQLQREKALPPEN